MKRNERACKGILIARSELPRHFLGCCDSCAMVFLTCCPEHDVGFEPKFHCGADGKPTPLFEVSSQSTRARSQCREKRACRTRSQRRREGSRSTLLLRCLRFDLLNHDGHRTAPFVNLAACGDFVSSKRQKLQVLAARWCGVRDRPVDRSIVCENNKL
jgi:hypothetical protein